MSSALVSSESDARTVQQGDLGEFNQCASQLRVLYEQGLNGHRMEFLAYRILYLLFSRNRSGASSLDITPAARARLTYFGPTTRAERLVGDNNTQRALRPVGRARA